MKIRLTGEEQRARFSGAYNNEVHLTLFPRRVHKAGHVVMLAFYRDQFVFTRHKERGIEWPGGKVEAGETPCQAAIRELREETGGVAASLTLIGQYELCQAKQGFVKNIYAVQVAEMNPEWQCGPDTEGAILVPYDVQPAVNEGFSPLVCDTVFLRVRRAILDM